MKLITFIILSALLPLLFGFSSCSTQNNRSKAELADEIVAVEAAFAKMAADSGIGPAFVYFASDNAVILRGKELVRGKDSIALLFRDRINTGESLTWKPDFVDVAASGDLAYTYGKYIYSVEVDGKAVSDTGIFNTVWRRDSEGNCKFVWD